MLSFGVNVWSLDTQGNWCRNGRKVQASCSDAKRGCRPGWTRSRAAASLPKGFHAVVNYAFGVGSQRPGRTMLKWRGSCLETDTVFYAGGPGRFKPSTSRSSSCAAYRFGLVVWCTRQPWQERAITKSPERTTCGRIPCQGTRNIAPSLIDKASKVNRQLVRMCIIPRTGPVHTGMKICTLWLALRLHTKQSIKARGQIHGHG